MSIMRRRQRHHPLYDIECQVEAAIYINGTKIDPTDLGICVQRLLNVSEEFLPEWYLDDTDEHKELRKAIKAIRDLKAFE